MKNQWVAGLPERQSNLDKLYENNNKRGDSIKIKLVPETATNNIQGTFNKHTHGLLYGITNGKNYWILYIWGPSWRSKISKKRAIKISHHQFRFKSE